MTAAVPVLPDAVCVAVIVADPKATAVTTPVAPIVATAGFEETKVDPLVTGPVVKLLYVAVTVRSRARATGIP